MQVTVGPFSMEPKNSGSQAATSILIVDDDHGIVTLLKEWLEEAGYSVRATTNSAEALRIFFDHRPSLSVVDLRMPGIDGFQLIARIRELSDAPILVLSALDSDEHVVRGLDLGADEYLVKPASRQAFLARVRSLLRRTPPDSSTSNVYTDSALLIDYRTRKVTAYKYPVELRPLEFKLLAYLVQHRDRMVSHDEILDKVWGAGEGSTDSLKWYVSSLRRKVEIGSAEDRLIVNLRSLGYRYVPPEERDPQTR
ncbi:MAG: response regulator transcription factor [Chloroflexi bacterium]|nr:response regulator transcription factor [Chloroflexota bacterium]